MDSESMDSIGLLYWGVITALVVIISVLVTWRVLQGRFAVKLKQSMQTYKTAGRSVLKGQISEQLAPYLPPMLAEYNARDLRFLGSPVDFVGFVGMSEGLPDFAIHLIEIKTANAKLTSVEKKIQAAVQNGRVDFRVVYPEVESAKS